MSTMLNEFPLSGSTVAAALRAAANPVQLWTMTDIETLAEPPATVLGELWRRVHEGPVSIRTSDLCEMLEYAKQVISLDVRLDSDSSIRLMVEDGITVECGLPSS
jgi:hypothetical protein